MEDETFNRFIRVRFVIPIKIVIGAAIAALLNPNNLEVHRMITHAVTYSVVICMLYFVGDYMIYAARSVYRIIRRLNRKVER